MRDLPIDILDRFFTLITENIIHKQNKAGLWKIKDGERVFFDVLSALRRVGKLPDLSKNQFIGYHMISTADREREFNAAVQLKPEWIPCNVCYGHLAVIQNVVALQLLIQLGFETDQRIEKALNNLFEIDSGYNGFCKSNIHKKNIDANKI